MLVAGGDEGARASAVRLLACTEGFDVVGEAADAISLPDATGRMRPDVVLLDTDMPGAEQAVRWLRSQKADVRVLAYTSDVRHFALGPLFAAGACGMAIKGTQHVALAHAVRRAAFGEQIPGLAGAPAAGVIRQNTAATAAVPSLCAVEALASAIELRDWTTVGHVGRVCAYATAIARAAAPEFATAPWRLGYLLHDVGKLAVPEGVLLKPAPLLEAELELVRAHPVHGVRAVNGIEAFAEAASVIQHHHERWDGRGYPDAIARDTIPMPARICAVADALDAMTSDRPFRGAIPADRALAEIGACAGAQFDPDVVKTLLAIADADDAFAGLRSGRTPNASTNA